MLSTQTVVSCLMRSVCGSVEMEVGLLKEGLRVSDEGECLHVVRCRREWSDALLMASGCINVSVALR